MGKGPDPLAQICSPYSAFLISKACSHYSFCGIPTWKWTMSSFCSQFLLQWDHFDTFFFYISYPKKRNIWHMEWGGRGRETLYKYIAYYQNASVSEELRDKWHVYNYPSTTSISIKLLSVLKSRENVKVFFIKFQKLHMQKFAVSWSAWCRQCLEILFI